MSGLVGVTVGVPAGVTAGVTGVVTMMGGLSLGHHRGLERKRNSGSRAEQGGE